MNEDKEIIFIELVTNIISSGKSRSFPFCYLDTKSFDNLDKKIPVLKKILNGEKLTESEMLDKEIFEYLPLNGKNK